MERWKTDGWGGNVQVERGSGQGKRTNQPTHTHTHTHTHTRTHTHTVGLNQPTDTHTHTHTHAHAHTHSGYQHARRLCMLIESKFKIIPECFRYLVKNTCILIFCKLTKSKRNKVSLFLIFAHKEALWASPFLTGILQWAAKTKLKHTRGQVVKAVV